MLTKCANISLSTPQTKTGNIYHRGHTINQVMRLDGPGTPHLTGGSHTRLLSMRLKFIKKRTAP